MKRKLAVIDACCTINLLATGQEIAIVRSLGMTLLQTERVSREMHFLWTPPDEDYVRHKEAASTDDLRAAGLLTIRALDTEALIDSFVAAAERIKDNDASCIALAGVLGVPLISDDAKQRRVATDLFPGLELVSTLDIVHEAAIAMKWDDQARVEVAIALRWRGNFAAPRRDPRREWYISLLKRGRVEPP
jgi:predicted nucleic acid-binding protein